MTYEWCNGCGKQITKAEIPWCTKCAPECKESGTRYEVLVP